MIITQLILLFKGLLTTASDIGEDMLRVSCVSFSYHSWIDAYQAEMLILNNNDKNWWVATNVFSYVILECINSTSLMRLVTAIEVFETTDYDDK